MMRQRRDAPSLVTPRNLAAVGVLALLVVVGMVLLWPRPVSSVTVPALVGLEAGDAAAQLVELGLEVDIEPVEASGLEPGAVVGQEPPAGATVSAGSRVVLQIAREVASSSATTGPQEVTVPDVVGMPLNDAVEQLTELGLLAGSVLVVREDAAVGTVVSQEPAAGAEVTGGSTIRLEVADEPDEPAVNVIAWILGLGPNAPTGPPQFRAYELLINGDCPSLAEAVSTEGNDLAQLDAELGGLYSGAAAACLAAFHGQSDRWAEAEAALNTIPQPVSCVDVAAYDLLRRLVDARRTNPSAQFVQDPNVGNAHAPPCPTITALEPAQGTPGAVVRIIGTNLDRVLEVRLNYDDGVGDSFEPQLDGDALIFTVNEFTQAGEACVFLVAGDQWNAAGQRFAVFSTSPTQSPATEPIFPIENCPPESAE